MDISKAEDAIFTKRRLSLWGGGFLAANLGALAIRSFAGKWLFDKAGQPAFIDFIQWWVGGRFTLIRNAAGAYDYSTFSAAQAFATKAPPPVAYFHWVYPPTMLLLVAPIARLPYVPAFVVWVAVTLCVYVAAVYAILPELLTVVLALLPLPVVKNVFDGQAAFLTAGLLGLSMVFSERRPYLSGVFLGLLTYKPQFVLFFPLALVLTRQWRVILSATATAAFFAGAAMQVFGSDAWRLFLRSMHDHDSASFLPVGVQGLNQTVLGLMHELGAGLAASWIAHLAVALLATALACQIWMRSSASHSLKAAAFSIGVLLATPYMLLYDLTALAVPVTFLVSDAVEGGFLRGERLILLGCFLALFLGYNIAIGPIVLLALMGLVVRRSRMRLSRAWPEPSALPEAPGGRSSGLRASVMKPPSCSTFLTLRYPISS